MTIWDSICHSQWFKQTSIVRQFVLVIMKALPTWSHQILFLNKDDLFRKKILHSDIKNFFLVSHLSMTGLSILRLNQDYEGEPGDAKAGRDYFKRRFTRLAHKAGRSKEREIYIQYVTIILFEWAVINYRKCNDCDRYGDVASSNGCC